MNGIKYLFKLSRPRFWLYLAGPVLVGIAYGASSTQDLLSLTSLILFLYFLVPANIVLYGVNDIFDAEIDELNPKKEDKEVRYTGDTLVVASVLLSLFMGLGLFLVLPPPTWPWLLGFFILGIGYSTPPLRLKTTPLLDSVSNVLYVLPGGAAYSALAGVQPPLLAVLGGLLWTMAMHTFSAIPDIGPDREAGIRTTATFLGERRTYAYCALLWLGSAVCFGALDIRAGILLGVYPVLVILIALSRIDVKRAYWWYPFVNSFVGMILTMGGLWGLVYG
ncbi:MAG: prenyltransferase [Halobacteria archaeon]|nr:prenyltransferase [Halobacteria archaeon]